MTVALDYLSCDRCGFEAEFCADGLFVFGLEMAEGADSAREFADAEVLGGGIEPVLGGAQRGPNWLPTTPDSRKLFIRQGFYHWDEAPAQIRIERIDMSTPKPLPSANVMAEAMAWAGEFVTGLLYVDTQQEDLCTRERLAKRPLAQLDEEALRIGREEWQRLMQA